MKSKRTGNVGQHKSAPPAAARPRREVTLAPAVVVALLVAALVLAAVGYAVQVPAGQGPDEGSHELFVRTLAGEQAAAGGWRWGLPVLSTDPADANFEVHQPPLYYAVSAVLWRLGGRGPVVVLSLLATVLLVWATWRMWREVGGDDVALAAAAFVALLPMTGFLALRVGNDPLVNLLWALALWRWMTSLRDGPSPAAGGWAGLAVGAALLTKQNSVALVPLAVTVAALQGWRHGQWAAAARQLALTLVVALALAGWWYARNVVVYGDLLAQRVFDARFLSCRPTPQTLARDFAHRPEWRYWPYVGEWTVRTSVIYIGQNLLRLPAAMTTAHAVLLGVAGAAGLVAAGRRWQRLGCDAAVAGGVLHGVGLVLVVALLVRFNMTYFQAQGRYLFLMLPAWAMGLAGAPSRLWPPGSAGRRYAVLVVPLWLGLLNLLLLTAFVPGLLAPP